MLRRIDPFQTFAKYVGAIIHNPGVRTLNDWLAGGRGSDRVSRVLDAALNNEYTPRYLISGVDEAGSIALGWVSGSFLRSKSITER